MALIDLNILVQKFGTTISRVSHRMINNNELAKEAAQEVWFEIVKNIDTFKGDSEISTWIYSIARRTILKYSQKERVYKDTEINHHFDLGQIEYTGQEQDKSEWVKEKCDYCLTAFCHCLTNEARLIFLFRDIAGLPYSQISEIMEMQEENVRQVLSRSREKVRNFLNDNCMLYNPQGSCRCRIRKHVMSIDLNKEYMKLIRAAKLVDFFVKFDRELPRKNYWEKLITEVVTK